MVFKRADSDNDVSRTVIGIEFHKVGPKTSKLLYPYLVVLERGTAKRPCTTDQW